MMSLKLSLWFLLNTNRHIALYVVSQHLSTWPSTLTYVLVNMKPSLKGKSPFKIRLKDQKLSYSLPFITPQGQSRVQLSNPHSYKQHGLNFSSHLGAYVYDCEL